MSDETALVNAVPVRTARGAYARLFTLLFGAHRFYVGKWLTGLIYPALLLVILSLGVFDLENSDDITLYLVYFYLALLVVDACLIPRWVRQRNEWYAEDFRAHPNRYLIPDSDDIAPWARGQSRKSAGGIRSSAIRTYFFFWIVPLFTGVWAAELQSLEVLMIPIVVLIAIGLIGTLDKMLEHQPAMLEIPGVGPALDRVAEMRAYFWDHEPKVSNSLWGLFRNWKDYKPYWTLALVVAVTVVIEGVLSYEVNTRYIGEIEAAKIVGFAALIAGLVVLANLVPLTTLSFHYSLSGKRTRLRFMTAGAVAATLLGYHLPGFRESEEDVAGKYPSQVSLMRLERRMQDLEFRDELIEKMDVFLWYYVNLGLENKEMNRDFRNILVGLAPNDEADAFEIIEEEKWAAVKYYHAEGRCNLEAQADAADQAVSDDQAPKYSLLAVVKKNTDEVMMAKLEEAQASPEYEEMHVLDVVEFVSSKNIYYAWDDELTEFVDKPGCDTLLCDDAVGCL